jgi:hypothetical protein
MQDYSQFEPMNFGSWSGGDPGGDPMEFGPDIAGLNRKRAAQNAANAPTSGADPNAPGTGDLQGPGDNPAGGYDDGGVDGAQAGQSPSAFDAVSPSRAPSMQQSPANPNVFQPNVGAGVNQAALPGRGQDGAPQGGVNPNQSVFGKIHDKVQNMFVGGNAPAAAQYSGLSPQEIQALKPGFIESTRSQHFGGPGGQELWESRIQQAAAMKQAQQVQGKTADLFAKNPAPQNGSPEQLDAWARSVTPGLMALGNYKAIQQLAPLLKQKAAGAGDPYINAQGVTRYFDKTAGQEVPAGWTKVKTGSANPNDHLFVNPKDLTDQAWVTPGDSAKLADVAKRGLVESATEREQAVQAGTEGRFGITNSRTVGQEFNQSPVIQVLAKRAQDYGDFKTTLDEAKHANPAAYKGLISQMAPLVDPGVSLRLGMLQFINKLDPSLVGEAKTAYQRMVNGSYPQDQLDNLDKLVTRLHNTEAAYYDGLHEDVLRGSPGAAIYMRPTDLMYGSEWRGQGGSPKGQSDAEFFRSMGITPVRKP